MTNTELEEWKDYYNLEPFPADRQEYQMAVLCQVIAATNGVKAKVEDFMVCDRENKKTKRNENLANDIKKVFGVI